jgi:hypothetical protein
MRQQRLGAGTATMRRTGGGISWPQRMKISAAGRAACASWVQHLWAMPPRATPQNCQMQHSLRQQQQQRMAGLLSSHSMLLLLLLLTLA